MPAWDDYKADAKARGSLAHEVYVVHSTPAKSSEDVKASLTAHLNYQGKMEAAGKLMLAGPVSDETGEHMQGTGMIILRASSMEEARKIADADPMHASGARSYTLRKWMINEGSITLNVSLSAQTTTLG